MSDPQTTKMLQVIINGQSTTNERIDKLGKKVDTLRTELKTEIKEAKIALTKRMDKIGLQLAYLEDDTPTREEHNELTKKVDRLEQKVLPQV